MTTPVTYYDGKFSPIDMANAVKIEEFIVGLDASRNLDAARKPCMEYPDHDDPACYDSIKVYTINPDLHLIAARLCMNRNYDIESYDPIYIVVPTLGHALQFIKEYSPLITNEALISVGTDIAHRLSVIANNILTLPNHE